MQLQTESGCEGSADMSLGKDLGAEAKNKMFGWYSLKPSCCL